nr:MAG TPA: hypothetical protein [Caudoviricetes sp.]
MRCREPIMPESHGRFVSCKDKADVVVRQS